MKNLVLKNNFDDFFDLMLDNDSDVMKTDVKENDNEYLLDVELPGFAKENIKLELNDGYLVVEGHLEKNETDEKYLRKERYSRSVSRSFYVGNNVTEEDIKAKFDNGVLSVVVPKKENNKEQKYIEIE